MQTNWSLILNVLLLVGVIIAIGRMMRSRRQNFAAMSTASQPVLSQTEPRPFDDIIAVRKVTPELPADEEWEQPAPRVSVAKTPTLPMDRESVRPQVQLAAKKQVNNKSVMIFLQARENRQLAGYELLQTVLAAGLRFGEGQLFHRHQYTNGQGPVLCSLAAATATGVFDLQNIGAFSVRGLCLFMQASGNPTIDEERFAIMLDTARQLAEGLDTRLLDDRQRPFTEESLARYYQILNITEVANESGALD